MDRVRPWSVRDADEPKIVVGDVVQHSFEVGDAVKARRAASRLRILAVTRAGGPRTWVPLVSLQEWRQMPYYSGRGGVSTGDSLNELARAEHQLLLGPYVN